MCRIPSSTNCAAVSTMGFITLPKKPPPILHVGFQKGDRLRVRTGLLRGCIRLYENQAPHERIVVLMTILGAERPIEFAVGGVTKV